MGDGRPPESDEGTPSLAAELAYLERLLREREEELLLELRIEWNPPRSQRANEGKRNTLELAQRRARDAVSAVRAALLRLKNGEYGVCTRCARPIDDRRLAMIPEAELCARCQWWAESEQQAAISQRR